MQANQRTLLPGAWTLAVVGLLPALSLAANHEVVANANMTFSPANLTIVAGDTVTFRNGGGVHNVVSNPGSVTDFRCANGCDGAGGDGDVSSASWSATVTFNTPGVIGYYCQAHGSPNSGMTGRITVNAAPMPVRRMSDFDGDGRSDILWRNTASGANTIWRSGSAAAQTAVTPVSLGWRVVGLGDYNGDNRAHILWRNTGNGANVIWRSGSSGSQQAIVGVANPAWSVAGSGDYNGDGRADLLWRATTGANALWLSANAGTQPTMPVVSPSWRIVGSGDYNGDGRRDILWRNASTGANLIWRSANPAQQQAVTAVGNPAWSVVGSGDYNGDGLADILWRNGTTGANVIWRSASANSQQAMPSTAPSWRVAASGDYNGDGRADILWRNASTGANAIWLSGNAGTPQSIVAVPNLTWTIMGFTE